MRRRSRQLPWSLFLAAALVVPTGFARPSVVVSIHPLYDLVRQVAGDEADVVRILPVGASPDTFYPTPQAVAQLARADLAVTVGGIDLWLRDLLDAAGGETVRIDLLTLPPVLDLLARDFPDLAPAAGAAAIAWNAHVWLDPRTMAAALPDLAEALATVDPEHAEVYRARAAALADELTALDAELAAELAPISGAAFVPFHDAWPYFAARYGLDLIVEIEPFPGREPSPAYLAMALRLVEASGARAIFSEPQLSRRAAQVVADEAGVALFELDPLGGAADRQTYQDLLRWNARVLLDGLR